jgi:hypothetical protein
MSKYDKEREALGLKPLGASSISPNKTSRYAAEREALKNKPTQDMKQTAPSATTKTPIDQRLNLFGLKNDNRSYLGANLIPAYKEDTGLAKVGKGIVNYGVGGLLSLAGNIFGSGQQAIMQADRAAVNALTGKPQDFSEMSFGRDILGAKKDNLLTMAIGAGLDPATYIGGGILDDLSRAGQFGKGAVKGTAENLAAGAATGQRATKGVAPSAQQATREYLNLERNVLKNDALKTPDVITAQPTGAMQQLALPPAEKPFSQVKYSVPKNPKGTKWIETEFGNVPVKSTTGEGISSVKTIQPPRQKQTLFSENLIDRPFVAMKGDITRLSPKKEPLFKVETPTGTKIADTTRLTDDKGRTLSKALQGDEVYDEIVKNLEGTSTQSDNLIKDIAPMTKDKSGLSLNMKDVYRNMRDTFGKAFPHIKKNYLDPFDASKGRYVDEVKRYTDDIYNNVVRKLGINKGSKESAAVQWFGEKKRVVGSEKVVDPQTGKKVHRAIEESYTLDDLKKDFPTKWQSIVEADKIFRKTYDELIERVNATVSQIYPGNAEKVVPKRADYYRHFNEMAQGFEGLKNIFDTPSQIDPRLAGISEFVKPKTKWASFKQQRGKGAYKADAVGGFLDYIQPAAYSIHIDPHVSKFRGLAKDIAEATVDTKNANNTILWLNDFANSLAGKTNRLDRLAQDYIPGGRTTFKALNWLNGRVKANQVLGNARSVIAQTANIPVGIARIKDPESLVKGIGDTMAGIVGKKTAASQSAFLKERYMQDLINRFDTKIIDQPQKFAAWIMSSADQLGTNFIWNSAYRKALKDGATDAVKQADDLTRSIVAGRGIGEVPILQQSKVFQLVAPFQLEVANLWHVMGDMVKEKDFGAIVALMVGNYLFNETTERITGSGVVFDPVGAMTDALSEEDMTPLKVAGRLTGEVLSNVPLGQTVANSEAIFPTYGGPGLFGVNMPSRKELFGREDPTRFGSGLLIAKAAQDPLSKLIPPFGGAQAKKSIEGLMAFSKGSVEKKGEMRFPIEKNIGNLARSALFGQYSTPEAREYFDKNRRPLSEKQTKQVKASENPKESYERLMTIRKIDTIKTKIASVKKDAKLSVSERNKQIDKLLQQLEELRNNR